ncbi:MAG TPA: YdcF family protein [Candidatus Saccharimonadales bacterium]|nr:YdcF family protein [Candidatus Saccharimonadales bacterium]
MTKPLKIILACVALFWAFIFAVNLLLIDNHPPEKSDYIVVISGGDTVGRTKKGIELYKQAYAPKLLLSGDAADPKSPSNAKVMKNYAIENGIPEEDILIEENSKDTKQNATESILKLIKVGPQQKILLVTSPYHSKRAKIEFEKAFKDQTIEAKVISVNAKDKNWGKFWWLRPKSLIIATFELLKLPIVIVSNL